MERILADLMATGAKKLGWTPKYHALIERNGVTVGAMTFVRPDNLACLKLFLMADGADCQVDQSETTEDNDAIVSSFINSFGHADLDQAPLFFDGSSETSPIIGALLEVGAMKSGYGDPVYQYSVKNADGQEIKISAYKSGDLGFVIQRMLSVSSYQIIDQDVEETVESFVRAYNHDDVTQITPVNIAGWNGEWTPDHLDQWVSAFDVGQWRPYTVITTNNSQWLADEGVWNGGGRIDHGSWEEGIALALQPNGSWAQGYRPSKIKFRHSVDAVTLFYVRDSQNNKMYIDSPAYIAPADPDYSPAYPLDFSGCGDIDAIVFHSVYPIKVSDIQFYYEIPYCPAPEFSHTDGSTVPDPTDITLSCIDPEATIMWRYDDIAEFLSYDFFQPTANGERPTCILHAYTTKSGYQDSEVVTVTYNVEDFECADPDFDPPASQAIWDDTPISLSCEDPIDATVFWRYAGEGEFTAYDAMSNYPRLVDGVHNSLEAYATKVGYTDSPTITATYTFQSGGA